MCPPEEKEIVDRVWKVLLNGSLDGLDDESSINGNTDYTSLSLDDNRIHAVIYYLWDRFTTMYGTCFLENRNKSCEDHSPNCTIVFTRFLRYLSILCKFRPDKYSEYCMYMLLDSLCGLEGIEMEKRINLNPANGAMTPSKGILRLYAELLPAHKEKVKDRLYKLFGFNDKEYLFNLKKSIESQIMCDNEHKNSIVALINRIVNVEGPWLNRMSNIVLQIDQTLDTSQLLAKVCVTAVALNIKHNPEGHWREMGSIVSELFKAKAKLDGRDCSDIYDKTLSILDYSVLALVLNRDENKLVDILLQIFTEALANQCWSISSLFTLMFTINSLTNHLGQYNMRLLERIHVKLKASMSTSDSVETADQISRFAAAYICYYHSCGNLTEAAMILPHYVLFWSGIFEETMLLELFARMISLRLLPSSSAVTTETRLLAELQLLKSLCSVCTSSTYHQMHAHILVSATGCKDSCRIEHWTNKVYKLSVTSAEDDLLMAAARELAMILHPAGEGTIEVGISNARLPEDIRKKILELRFLVISITIDGYEIDKVLREDVLSYITSIQTQIPNYNGTLRHYMSVETPYVGIMPEFIDYSLGPIHFQPQLTDVDVSCRTHSPRDDRAKFKYNNIRIRLMTYISWLVKATGQIKVNTLIEDCLEQCYEAKDPEDKSRKNEICKCIEALVECSVLEWTDDNSVRWSN